MDAQIVVDSLVRATTDVCAMMLGINVTVGEPYVLDRPASVNQGVIALVGLAGDWVGNGCLSCTPQAACTLAGRFLSQTFTSVNDEVLDAVGEIGNIVIGNFKDDIEPYAGKLCLSVPTVVFGRNFTARSATGTSWTVIPFRFEQESLDVRVCLYRHQKQSDHTVSDAGLFVPARH